MNCLCATWTARRGCDFGGSECWTWISEASFAGSTFCAWALGPHSAGHLRGDRRSCRRGFVPPWTGGHRCSSQLSDDRTPPLNFVSAVSIARQGRRLGLLRDSCGRRIEFYFWYLARATATHFFWAKCKILRCKGHQHRPLAFQASP